MASTTFFLFSSPSPPLPLTRFHLKTKTLTLARFPLRRRRLYKAADSAADDAYVDDDYFDDGRPVVPKYIRDQFPPKFTEEEARRHNWITHGWAPWEEIFSPETAFARYSINEGEEVPLKNPQALEAFRMLTPSYRKKKVEESGLSEAELFLKLFSIKTEYPDPVETFWDEKLGVRLVPPRDWPPRGWKVDKEELEFIREAHRMEAERVDLEMDGVEVEREDGQEEKEMSFERYKVFLKQYEEWVAAKKNLLEAESYKV